VVEAVVIGPLSVRIFPANREKNREFRENCPSGLGLTSFLSVSSMPCDRIPCGVKRGIFSAEQGIVSTEQGCWANEQRIAVRVVSVHFSHACSGVPGSRSVLACGFADEENKMADENWSRARYDEAFWRAHHEAWRRTDLNQREYCKVESISLKAFGNWRHSAWKTWAPIDSTRPNAVAASRLDQGIQLRFLASNRADLHVLGHKAPCQSPSQPWSDPEDDRCLACCHACHCYRGRNLISSKT
jgi:hypothetical protein